MNIGEIYDVHKCLLDKLRIPVLISLGLSTEDANRYLRVPEIFIACVFFPQFKCLS